MLLIPVDTVNALVFILYRYELSDFSKAPAEL